MSLIHDNVSKREFVVGGVEESKTKTKTTSTADPLDLDEELPANKSWIDIMMEDSANDPTIESVYRMDVSHEGDFGKDGVFWGYC